MQLKQQNPWLWLPSVYFAQGLPFVIVMTVSVIMYKRLGISNAEIAYYTSWLYLPWVIKPFWSPIVDILKTRRSWIIAMQLLVGAGLAGVALTIPVDNFFRYTLAVFWLIAFSSATHDIAADGFYIVGLSEHHEGPRLVRRHPQYFLSTGDDHRAGPPGHVCRLPRNGDLQCQRRVEHHVLPVGGSICPAVRLASLQPSGPSR